ncbi:MAG: GNAT family N-acetyltransferase [Bacteroidota bacterium]
MSNITVHNYSEANREEWEQFVNDSNNGTMFHKQAFLDYHPKDKFNFHHLMFRCDGELVGVLPGGLSDNGEVFWSPMGASYGSIVTKDAPFNISLGIVDAMMEYFRTNNFRDIYLIPPPIIYNKFYNQHIEYAMLYRRFDFEYHYISHAINLTEDYEHNYDKKTQKQIQKIKREGKIHIVESDDYDAFYPILVENKAKHNVKPTHSLEDLYKLRELLPDNLKLFMVYAGDEPIAGALMFLTNSKVALCFYIMLYYKHKELRPNFLALDYIAKWARDSGYEWLDIGVSQDTSSEDPMTPSDKLIYFKERFHARGLLRSTFHFKFRD